MARSPRNRGLTPPDSFLNAERHFNEWERRSGSGRRRDIEKYAFVALAIGRYPDNPPAWALQACVQLYTREVGAASSPLLSMKPSKKRPRAISDELLDMFAYQLVRKEGAAFAIFMDRTNRPPDRRLKQVGVTINGAAKDAVVSLMPEGFQISEDHPTKQALRKYWRELPVEEKRQLLARGYRKYVECHRPKLHPELGWK
jgi:hypothetical protein